MLGFRRADVAAFWTLGTAVVAVAAGAAAVLADAPPWAWAAGVATALLLPGLWWRPWFERGVWIWNGVARRLVVALRRYTLATTYFVVFACLRAGGSRLDRGFARPSGSGWLWPTAASDGADELEAVSARRGLVAFARRPGNAWAWCLVPMMVLLELLRTTEQESAPLSSTYTLY